MPQAAAAPVWNEGLDFEPVKDQPPWHSGLDFQPVTNEPWHSGLDFEPLNQPASASRTQDGDSKVGHRLLNDVRSYGSDAGKYIFHGLEALSLEQAKMLADPPPEAYQTSAEETLLPAEQQRALEESRKANMREQVQPALDTASYWWKRASQVDAESKVDPALANTWDARLSRAAGSATIMGMEGLIPGAGIPIMALNGAAATEAEARNAGKTDLEAETAATRSLIGLAIFGGANKVAALGVAKVLPHFVREPGRLATFIGQFIGQDAANETSSRAIAAWNAAAEAKPGEKVAAATKALSDSSLETSTLNAVYAGIGALHEAGKVKPLSPDEKLDFEPLPEPTSIEVRQPIADAPAIIPDIRTAPAGVTIEQPGMIPIEQLAPETTAIAPIPHAPLFRADDSIPFMTKVRIEDELHTQHGLTDEQIATLTSDQVRTIRNSQPALPSEPAGPLSEASNDSEAVTTSPPPAERSIQRVSPEDLRAEDEYRRQLVEDAQKTQAGHGAELLEAVMRAGGLPSKESPHRKTFAGEIAQIDEIARYPLRAEPIALNKLFRKDAPSVDELATRLRDQGFIVDRPDDLLTLVDDRIRNGKPIYGQPELARVFASGTSAPRQKGNPRPITASEFQGDYGTGATLRRSSVELPPSAKTTASKAELSRIQERFIARSNAIAENRSLLASQIEKGASESALTSAGLRSEISRGYARDLIAHYADAARGGVLPRQPRLPIYRADFERYKTGYGLASRHAFRAVHQSLRTLGFTPQEHIFASGASSPRLRPSEKGTADLFQGKDAPFNLASEEAVDWTARETRERATAQAKTEAQRQQEQQQGKLFASAATTPAAHRSPKSLPPGMPSAPPPGVRAAVAPLRSWWQQRTLGIRKFLAPQTIDVPARMVANIIRDYNGQLANKIIQADHALDAARRDFDRTPVPRSWKYDPTKPLPRNYAFMAESEKGGAGLSASDRALKKQLDGMFADAVDEVHRVKPAALKSLIQDFFPHIWEDPETAARVFAQIIGHRPLEGSKNFLKQRTLAYVEDGLKAALRPISDNPIDMVLTKLHEVLKFVNAQDILTEAKAIGARKFVYIFEKAPEGWIIGKDATSTVHAPPFVTVPEAFDEQMKVKTIELLTKLGVPNERVAKLGGKRWGTAQDIGSPPGRIRTKFAGPLSVYWHELGHVLQFRYGWIDQMLQGEKLGGKSNIAVELRNLADLRSEGSTPSKSFHKYLRSKDEKAAVMLEGYMHAPRKMQDVAPVLYGRVKKFIAAHPELHAIDDIRPSLVLGTGKQQIDVGGMVTLGNYYMPEGAATVFNNYLSPGLQRFGVIRSIRQSTNILSGMQLGFSAFHAGFTSIDAAVSQFALGLRYASEGKLAMAAKKILTTPAAPVTNYLTGLAVQKAMLKPGSGTPEIENIAQLAVKGGMRATVDPFWKTQITRNMMRSLHEGGVKGYAGTLLRLPFAASEQMMRPILEKLVVRQKLGVIAGMAQAHMERLGPNADIHAVRDVMAKVVDAAEDRMGQMTYDNLFYNRYVRDMALMGFRAYGWTYGKYRSLFAGMGDVIGTPGRIGRGEPVLTDRMAYLIALPMVAAGIGSVMNYLNTGQAPQDWKDALMPRTGKTDRNGNPQRLALPTYIKDILSDWHDFPHVGKMLVSVGHKLNPWLSVGGDILNNADFYGTKVYNEDDPVWREAADAFKFIFKSARPFSVTGAARLSESHPSMTQQALPFFGFVPAKAELTMTAAQIRAVELMHEQLPRGARTTDQAEHSRLVAQLIRDAKTTEPTWQNDLQAALASGKMAPNELAKFFQSLPFTPFQYQVRKLSAENAMKVWDLANASERDGIRAIVLMKLGNSKTITPEERVRYLRVVIQK